MNNLPGICLSTRLNLAFVCFLGTVLIYALRSNVSFAIVCMVNTTALEISDTSSDFDFPNQSLHGELKESECPRESRFNASDPEEKVFLVVSKKLFLQKNETSQLKNFCCTWDWNLLSLDRCPF